VVRALLDAKADVNARNDSGDTALDLATTRGHNDVRALLLQAGAKP
jgi:ankyrin repeat protein